MPYHDRPVSQSLLIRLLRGGYFTRPTKRRTPEIPSWHRTTPRTVRYPSVAGGVQRATRRLRSDAAEDGTGFLVGSDLMEEIANFRELVGRNDEIGDFVAPLIVKNVLCDLDFAFVSGIGAFGVDRRRELVGYVAGRERDIEDVILASSLMELNRVFSSLAGQQS
jgi:hypothetical protein